VLLLSHGLPPREQAGTEQHTLRLAAGLREAGCVVNVLAATRAPGMTAWSTFVEEPLPGIWATRLVNNLPARALALGESDPAVDACFAKVQASFRPDIVHVQHLQFLSSSLPFQVPYVLTLHDRWMWCPAGGLGLLPDGNPCPGPKPETCAPCAAAWAPRLGRSGQGLVHLAGALSPIIDPRRLHRWYQRLPDRLRVRVHRGTDQAESPNAASFRAETLARFARNAAVRIAPSKHLARLAEAQGLGPVQHIPHGLPEETWLSRRTAASLPEGAPFLFLGTIAHHKGPDLVVAAWRLAFPQGDPPLRICGPDAGGDCLGHSKEGALDRAGVAAALAGARALVLGSRWEENAPLVILEARAAGCPVVAPASGGIPELLEDGRDGLLYRPRDVQDLARCLRTIHHDPPRPVRPPPGEREMVQATLRAYEAALRHRGGP
jgi:glycosyltransferase involved in cell wall biosynthesis